MGGRFVPPQAVALIEYASTATIAQPIRTAHYGAVVDVVGALDVVLAAGMIVVELVVVVLELVVGVLVAVVAVVVAVVVVVDVVGVVVEVVGVVVDVDVLEVAVAEEDAGLEPELDLLALDDGVCCWIEESLELKVGAGP